MTPADELAALIQRANELVAQISDRAERERAIDRAAWTAGYRAGYASGWDVGYRAAENDMDRAWAEVGAKVRAEAARPLRRDLEARRHPDKTPAQLREMRGRTRYPLPARECPSCGRHIDITTESTRDERRRSA